jgi:hypothetical protein
VFVGKLAQESTDVRNIPRQCYPKYPQSMYFTAGISVALTRGDRFLDRSLTCRARNSEMAGPTPKALANFSPRVGAQRQPWDSNVNSFIKPCKGSAIGERFQRFALISNRVPRVVASLPTAGLKLANAFGVIISKIKLG